MSSDFAAGFAIGSCGESGRAGDGISLLARFIVDKINSIFGWLRGVMSSMRIEGACCGGMASQHIDRA